jgi:hypothetical protein
MKGKPTFGVGPGITESGDILTIPQQTTEVTQDESVLTAIAGCYALFVSS